MFPFAEITAFLLLLVLVTGFTLMVYYSIFYAPFVPTPYPIVRKMVDAASLRKGDVMFDLGCGDGRMPMLAAKQGAQAYGVEVAWPVYLLARLNMWLHKSSAKILRKNFFDIPLHESRAVLCYLWPSLMDRLAVKFANEMETGSRVISYSFPISAWKPVKTIPTIPGNNRSFLIYVYEIGTSNP